MVADLVSITYTEVSLSLLFHHSIPRGYTHSSRNPNPCAPPKSTIHYFAPLLWLLFFLTFETSFLRLFNSTLLSRNSTWTCTTVSGPYPSLPMIPSILISPPIPPLIYLQVASFPSLLCHLLMFIHRRVVPLWVCCLIPSATLLFHEPTFSTQKTPEPTF